MKGGWNHFISEDAFLTGLQADQPQKVWFDGDVDMAAMTRHLDNLIATYLGWDDLRMYVERYPWRTAPGILVVDPC